MADKAPKVPFNLLVDPEMRIELEKEAMQYGKLMGIPVSPSALVRVILNHRREIKFIYDKLYALDPTTQKERK